MEAGVEGADLASEDLRFGGTGAPARGSHAIERGPQGVGLVPRVGEHRVLDSALEGHGVAVQFRGLAGNRHGAGGEEDEREGATHDR